MNLYSCKYQREVTAALRERQWPEVCTPELRKHVEECAACRDLVLVSQSLRRTRQQTMSIAQPVSPGLLWWKAQIRRRQEMVERAQKPFAIFEIITMVVSLIVVVIFAASQRSVLKAWLDSFTHTSHPESSQFDWVQQLFAGSSLWLPLLISTVILGLAGGLVAFLIHRED